MTPGNDIIPFKGIVFCDGCKKLLLEVILSFAEGWTWNRCSGTVVHGEVLARNGMA
jgi:hypothetical protein